MRQFILEKQNLKNGVVKVSGKDYHYLRQVLRVKTGDMLNVRFPDGQLQSTTVASIVDSEKTVTLQVCDVSEKTITRGVQATEITEALKAREYWLFQFLPKPQKLELIVRQATECGIAVIVPVIGEYTEKSSVAAMEGTKAERLERIIKEARQQSGSAVQTRLEKPVTLEKAIELWNGCNKAGAGFVLSERKDGAVKLWETAKEFSEKTAGGPQKICIAVGSEGGISPEEVQTLLKAGFSAVHFDVNILRCETAAIYGIAAVQTCFE